MTVSPAADMQLCILSCLCGPHLLCNESKVRHSSRDLGELVIRASGLATAGIVRPAVVLKGKLVRVEKLALQGGVGIVNPFACGCVSHPAGRFSPGPRPQFDAALEVCAVPVASC